MTKSAQVRTCLRNNPKKLEENLVIFREEMALLGEKPVLIAMGNDPFDILNEHLADTYTIYKISHYARAISPDDLRSEILALLKQYAPNAEKPAF